MEVLHCLLKLKVFQIYQSPWLQLENLFQRRPCLYPKVKMNGTKTKKSRNPRNVFHQVHVSLEILFQGEILKKLPKRCLVAMKIVSMTTNPNPNQIEKKVPDNLRKNLLDDDVPPPPDEEEAPAKPRIAGLGPKLFPDVVKKNLCWIRTMKPRKNLPFLSNLPKKKV